VCLALACAIAIYGSHRISTLGQAAFEARKLGQYYLKQPLGSGGMGQVYLAEHRLLRRPCVVKVIRPDRCQDPAMLARFEREVHAMAQLSHWNTVEVFDYGRAADGTFYYVMEYLPGMTLGEAVERHGPLPPARAVYLLRQVCAALREAHAAGLIHRDIKPGNIMVCQRGGLSDVIKLLDFGLVRPLAASEGDRLTLTGTIAGTPGYMSPEQAAGQEDLDARTDIYSVGAVAYFLLAGRPPFDADTPWQTLAAHLYEPVTPLSQVRADIPGDLEAVVLRCLRKEPPARYPDADSLDAALDGCEAAGGWTAASAAAWWQAISSAS